MLVSVTIPGDRKFWNSIIRTAREDCLICKHNNNWKSQVLLEINILLVIHFVAETMLQMKSSSVLNCWIKYERILIWLYFYILSIIGWLSILFRLCTFFHRNRRIMDYFSPSVLMKYTRYLILYDSLPIFHGRWRRLLNSY